MKEVEVPSAKEMFKETNESQAEYNRLVNNIVYGIKKEVAKGFFNFRELHIDAYHAKRLAALFIMKGYEVEIDRNRIGDDYRITIEWCRYEIESKD